MPDRYIDEETENRQLSLCLFDVAGITVLNRCSNCPGAARAAFQHRRCPREHLQPNIFRPEGPDSKISAPLKSLASSSKQHDEADTVLPDGFARLSLVDSDGTDGTFGRSESDPDIPDVRAELSGTPPIPHGIKRKFRRNEFDQLSVQEYLKLKPQKLFRDLESGNLFVRGGVRVRSDEMTALLNNSAISPMDTKEDRLSSSRPFVPGCCINTEVGGCGLLACNDGIETEGFDEMEIEEI